MVSLEFENFNVEEPSNQEIPSDKTDDLYIGYSLKVVDCLMAKLKAFNKEDQKTRISLDQVKKVFINSASSYSPNEDITINEHALARVNMFLAIKSGRNINYDLKNTNIKLFDASSMIIPIEEDYIQAKKDVEEYELNLNFKSIDNLYIYTKEDKIKTIWE